MHTSQDNRMAAVLAVSPFEDDHRALRIILAAGDWKLISVRSMAEGIAWLAGHPVAVVVCSQHLPDGNWLLLLERAGAVVQPPRLVVSSRLADDQLWAEVLNLGGYDVLATPFDSAEVRRVMLAARDSWHGGSRYRLRANGASV